MGNADSLALMDSISKTMPLLEGYALPAPNNAKSVMELKSIIAFNVNQTTSIINMKTSVCSPVTALQASTKIPLTKFVQPAILYVT